MPLTIQSLQQTVLDEKNPFGGLAPGRTRLKNFAVSMLILQSFPRKDIVKTAIKCLRMSHPSLRDTFSPRAKALIAVTLFIRRAFMRYPSGVAHTRNAPLLSLEGQRHFPYFIGEISFDYAQGDII